MAFDRSERQDGPALPIAVVLAESPELLTRRIAGLAALSRVLIELDRAGMGEALVGFQPSADLAARVRDELARAGRGIAVRWTPPERLQAELGGKQGQVLALDGGAIVKAAALTGLEQSGLLAGGRVRAGWLPASQVGPGELQAIAATQSAPGAVLPLDRPAAASRAVMRETGKASDGPVSRWLNRPVSQALSTWLLHIDTLRPVQLTVLTLVMAFGMFASLAHGTVFSLGLGCVLFHLTSVIDGLDGEVARATYRTSSDGARLDTAVDMATNLLCALGLTIGLTRLHGPFYAYLGAFTCISWFVGILVLTWMVKRGPGGGSFDVLKAAYHARAGNGLVGRLVVLGRVITSRDFFAFGIGLMGLFGVSWLPLWCLGFFVGLWPLILGYGGWLMLRRRPARIGEA